MGRTERSSAPSGRDRFLHWWHLAALLVLVCAVEAGKGLLGGVRAVELLTGLPHPLYNWCPIVAGVAVSIRRADRASAQAAFHVGLVVTLLMLALDLVGGLTPPPEEYAAAVTPGGVESRGTVDIGSSWVLTGAEWLTGDLTGTTERIPLGRSYPTAHPRVRAADALQDASLIFLVFGTLGLVLAAGRWIRGHVTFQRKEDERGAHLVVAWLLSPMVMVLTLGQATDQRAAALFYGGSLWTILLPPLGVLALGIIAWVGATRSPPDDESADTVGS